jgi:glyoxylase-like metal-dependent hydrolase (beta-lactamase superfamily II)
LIYTRTIGDARVSNVIEYTGPTHAPDFLFPKRPADAIERNAHWLAPHQWIPRMQRFVVTIQLWVVHAGGNVIVIDTGVGNHKTRSSARMHQLNTLTLEWLQAIGAGPDDVTHVVFTHLHNDHVGWNTRLEGTSWIPTFPKARYLFPRRDYDWFLAQLAAGKVSENQRNAIADSIVPIFEAGLADFIDETKEVAGCLAVEPLPGHTPGQLSYRLRSRGEEGVFCGDVMHSPLQIALPALSGAFCIDPDMSAATRTDFLRRAAERNALIMPCHFGYPHCGYVRHQEGTYAFVPERD